MESDQDLQEKRKMTCKTFMRKFIKFMFSNVGLLCLLVGYTIMGAYAFMMLEGVQDTQTAAIDIAEWRNKFLMGLYNMTINGEPNWMDTAAEMLANFTEIQRAYDSSESALDVDDWGFLGSLVFCVTVTTTIGKLWCLFLW